MKVMEVLYTEGKSTYIDFIPEGDWMVWVKEFFIEGGLDFPTKIDSSKTIQELTENDYIKFFEKLGWEFLGISEYNPKIHIKQTLPNSNGGSNNAEA